MKPTGELVVNELDFRFYFGCASGSARKALRKMEEPNVMINYATANNTPFETIERLFIDSGGYSQLHTHQEYQSSDRAYLDYVATYDPERFVLRDYPCDPARLSRVNRSVRDHQQRTTQHHRQLLDAFDDAGIAADPVAVLQGWEPHQYLRHLDELRSAGVLTHSVAIGSLCRSDPAAVAHIIHRVREALPGKHRMHGFGVKPRVLQFPRVVRALDSADSTVYEFRTRMQEDRATWREHVYQYLRLKRQLQACFTNEQRQQSLHQYTV